MNITSIILAAGQGTRMRSRLPKVLHLLAGRPLICHCIDAAQQVCQQNPIVVLGHGADAVQKVIAETAQIVIQEQQLGTAHAVMATEPVLAGKTGLILVTYGDMPLLTPETLQRLVQVQQSNPGPITLLTIESGAPRGFGRILRKPDGSLIGIIEEAQASPQQLNISELNAGIYCFQAKWLYGALKRVPLSPKGEYYLTDLVGLAVADGLHVSSLLLEDASEALGINNRIHLAEAEMILRRRTNQALMLSGVTLVDPETTYIDPGVRVGTDTIIYPNTHLRSGTTIGEDCRIGPNTLIEGTLVGNRCAILYSVLEGAVVEDGVSIGPFGHLRKGAHLAENVHMGNFGEVKDSYLGPGTKMGHFSYIGNATTGTNVNIGAGTITCNFDGVHKFPTEIGSDVFIGSDTMLVAPLKLGERSRTGAGSVVTHDVPPDTTVYGVPARQHNNQRQGD